ncbi:Hypothetical predicted protein [Octopus vulgaris]|uniref:Uncharacterized protein n=1 Tax=Octopus vulgaris TaxID=6645 RepID=A0AA36F110_OCTVU|nr:Hypothetical predicted protein [Octopus vulgaris]
MTLDGSGTFHGIGIITVVTLNCDGTSVVKQVSVTAENIAAVEHISTLGNELVNISYKNRPENPKRSPKLYTFPRKLKAEVVESPESRIVFSSLLYAKSSAH